MPENYQTPRIEDTQVESHPFKAAFHGREDGSPGYLSVESGYIIPSGFVGGFDAILPKFAGAPLQDQHHTTELTHIEDPSPGDYYVEATGEWRTLGYDGDNKNEMFEPHTAEVKHHSALDLTHEKKRALKIFRLESDGRVSQYIKSDIPMSLGRSVPSAPPWEEPSDGSDSGSSSSSSSSSGSSGSWTGWGSDSSSGSAPYKWATFDFHDYPPVIYPGVSSNVQVRLRNDGTLPWEVSDQLLPMGYDWGVLTVSVPYTYPGVTRDFNFEIQAPMTPGTYPFSWQLYGPTDYFGEQTPVVDIVVPDPAASSSSAGSSSSSGPAPYDRATYVSQHVIPEEMYVDEETWVQLTFRNTGETTWFPGTYKLIPMAHHWGMFEIGVPSVTPPGVDRTFDATMTAPGTPGTYYWEFMMEGPNGVFEEAGPSVPVIVSLRPTPPEPEPSSSSSSGSSGGSTPSSSGSGSSGSGSGGSGAGSGFRAAFVFQLAPEEMEVGTETEVTLRYRNIGTESWVPDVVELRSQNPEENETWGVGSVGVPTLTLPGAERDFVFPITAPLASGSYNFQWQLSDGFGYFGPMSPNREINVIPAPPSSD